MSPRQTRLSASFAFAAFVVFVAALPAFISDFKARDYAYVGIYLIALLGLNVLTGYTGQISLGHGAFMAIGGYTTAILMAGNEQFGGPMYSGMKDLWTLPIAGVVTGLIGLAFGVPALRLSVYTSRSRHSSLSRCPPLCGGSTSSREAAPACAVRWAAPSSPARARTWTSSAAR